MSQVQKKVVLTLSSLLIAGLLLAGTVAALAAASLPFDKIGTFSYDNIAKIYSVGTQTMTVTQNTTCTDLDGVPVSSPCTDLLGSLVEATGFYTTTTTSSTYTATVITELGTYIGVIKKIDTSVTPNVWTVGSMEFKVGSNTTLGGTFAEGDVAKVTYKKDGAAWLALMIDPVETFTLTGEVTAIGDTEWTIKGQPFVVNGDTLIYDGAVLHDIVTVTYYVGDDGNVAVKIELFAPIKNENSRCEGRIETFPIPKGILNKLEGLEGFDLLQVRAMFCQGFGWGEIVKAFSLENTGFSPAELLALKAQGNGWGQIKKMHSEDTVVVSPTNQNNSNNNENNGNGNSNKPDNPGNSNHDKDNKGKGKNK